MNRTKRLVLLGYTCIGIALACCASGIIALGRDQVVAGAVLMAAMFAMTLLADMIFGSVEDKRAPVAWSSRIGEEDGE